MHGKRLIRFALCLLVTIVTSCLAAEPISGLASLPQQPAQPQLAQSSGPIQPAQTVQTPDAQVWNLKNADIRAVIQTVSALTGKNFIIDPRVQGKVTLVSQKPMTPNELYQVFLSMLQLLQYVAIPSGNVIKIVPAMEGSRAILTEIQALTNKSGFALPVRRSLGIDANRLQLLTATISKRAGVFLGDQDVFVNIAGGLQVRERGIDLGVCLAIASSLYDKVISKDTIAIGEVGLLGEIRSTPYLDKRITEARKLGAKNFLTSKQVRTLSEAVKKALSLKS